MILQYYLKTDEPYDKAGAYAIQGYFGRFVERYEGSLNNVIGFPLEEILPVLAALKMKLYDTIVIGSRRSGAFLRRPVRTRHRLPDYRPQ